MRNIAGSLTFLFVLIYSVACQPEPYKQGQALYQIHCENCHMEDGSGLPGLIPSLTGSRILGTDSLICLIRKGVEKNPVTGQQMPPNKTLNEVEITNIVNYLKNLLLPDSSAIKVAEVHKLLESCQ